MGKEPPERLSSTLLEKLFYQILLINSYTARLQEIDFWIHVTQLKKTSDSAPSDDLKMKTFQNLTRQYLMRQLSQNLQTRPVRRFKIYRQREI